MARWHIFLFGIVGAILQVGCENKYENHTLLKIFPATDEQLDKCNRFNLPDVEILKVSHGHNDSLDVLVPPSRLTEVRRFAEDHNVSYDIKHHKYGRSLQEPERTSRRRLLPGFNIFGFNSYTLIMDYLQSVARKHPDLVTLQTLGNSYQGRKMVLVRVSSDPTARKPVIFIDAGIHAREWVAPAMALYIIHRLTSDPEAVRELNGVDWYIMPLVNPDGYEFTRSSLSNRMWRKTRSSTGIPNCYGVDGNRNYGFKWGVSGVTNNPCDRETYAGPRPFSEPETQMVRDVMIQNRDRLKLYVSLHSYGNYLVYPWGFTGDYLPKSWKKLDRLAKKVSKSIQNAGGDPFKVLSAGKWYAAAGGSDDFAFGAVGIPYAYTMELTDGYEFNLPEYLLQEVLPQFYEGFKTFGVEISKEFGTRNEAERIRRHLVN